MKINQKIVFSSSSLLSALVKKPTLATRIARHHRRALTRALESARNILESFRWREPKWQDLPRGEGEEETLKRENKRCERTERQIQVVRCSDSFHAQTNTRVLPLWNFPKDTGTSMHPNMRQIYSFDPCIYNIISYELFFPFFLSLSYFLSPRNFTLYNTILNLQKNVAMREKLGFSREIAIAARFLFSD